MRDSRCPASRSRPPAAQPPRGRTAHAGTAHPPAPHARHTPQGDNVKIQTQRAVAHLLPSLAPPSTLSVAKQIWQREGPRGLYCCLDGQLMQDGLFYGCFFGGYKALKAKLTQLFPGVPEQPITFVSGGLAGMLSWVAVLPVQVHRAGGLAAADRH